VYNEVLLYIADHTYQCWHH